MYSFIIGLRNTVIAVLTLGVGMFIVAHPEVANQSVVDFVSHNLSTVIGTITVGGLFNLVLDYIHQKYNIASAARKAAQG